MRYIAVILALALVAPVALAKSLQEAYDAAPSGEGYDKLLVLDPNVVYTGRCDLLKGKKSCIRGNGALIDLERGQVCASQAGTELVITGCCLINGGVAVGADTGATALVDGNTICKSEMGVRVWQGQATIKNNIVWGNDYGITRDETSSPTILYNDVDNNPKGNYMYFCPG